MKTILCALITLLSVASAAAAPAQVDTIRTLHGKTYRHCRILKRDADGVAFTHQKGTARVLYADLPSSTRYELGYDAKAEAQLERSRAQERADRLEVERLRLKRAGELLHAARLAEIKRLSVWNEALMAASYYQSAGVAPFAGPVPAVGFADPSWGWGWGGGWNNGFGWGGGWHHHPHHRRPRVTWEGVGIATIGSGSGGIYTPQSGGFIFTGPTSARYSPTLGYYNLARVPTRSFGTFNVVPGLMAPNPPAVVPGVGRRGSVSLPAPR